MKYHQIILFIVFLLFSCEEDTVDVETHDREIVLTHIGEQIIMPYHRNFKKFCGRLHQGMKLFQERPSKALLETLQNQWKETQVRWKRCEVFNFGEAKNKFMHHKIGKWPTNAKLLEKNLASKESLSREFVANSGSNSKGLSAIEYLMFGHTFEYVQTPRVTEYLVTMTADLLDQATKLEMMWKIYLKNFESNTENGIRGSINILVNTQISLLEQIVTSKLGKPLGKNNGSNPNPKYAEAFRSQFSLRIIRANLEGLETSFFGNSSQIGLHKLDELGNYKKDTVLLHRAIRNQFGICFTTLDNIQKPLSELVISHPESVRELQDVIRTLLTLFKVDLASALSITVTFNDNDGD